MMEMTKKKNKVEIMSIAEHFDNATCECFYEITIHLTEKPNLKLGECEIIQK